MNRYPVADSVRVDAGQQRTKHLRRVPLLGRVGLLAQGLRAVPKHRRPLRDRVVVVGRRDGRVDVPVVNLHARPRAVVSSRVGVVHPLGPPLGRRAIDLAARAGAVPPGDGVGEEAPRRDARVVDDGREEVGVGGREDALWVVLVLGVGGMVLHIARGAVNNNKNQTTITITTTTKARATTANLKRVK